MRITPSPKSLWWAMCLEADLVQKIATAYVQKIEEGQKGLVLAFTNRSCETLNHAIRAKLQEKEKMGEDVISLNGKSFALGDHVVFLENDKTRIQIRSFEDKQTSTRTIHNGTRGTVVQATESLLTIQLDAQTQALVETKTYTRLAHGYAVNTHKFQGQTVDFTLIQASKFMDAKGLYFEPQEIPCSRRTIDQALYMTLRLQKADLRSEVPDSLIDQTLIESAMFTGKPQEKIELVQERAVQKLLTVSALGPEKQDDSCQ